MKRFYRFVASVSIVFILFTIAIPSRASNTPSKINDALLRILDNTDPQKHIDSIYIELKIEDEEYQAAVSDSGISVYDIDVSLSEIEDNAPYETVKALITQKRNILADFCRIRNAQFVQEMGITDDTIFISCGNIIVGSYSPEQILKIMGDYRVVSIGWDDPEVEIVSLMEEEYNWVRIKNVVNAGYNGNGIKIGVIEQARKNFYDNTNPNSIISVATSGEPDYEPPAEIEHAKRVLGILRRVAPGSIVYITKIGSGSNAPTQIMSSAALLALTYEVDVLNISQGMYSNATNSSSAALYLNSLVKDFNLTICCACGNAVSGTDSSVSILSAVENVIGVGGVKSIGLKQYIGIAASQYCDWRYSEYGQYYVNKPDFCASAADIKVVSPTSLSVSEASGTSFSTPIICGIIADLMDRNSTLIGKQSLVKAVLSAGARFKGDSSLYVASSIYHGICFSDKEGTGVVDALNAYSVLNNGRYTTKSVNSSQVSQYKDITINTTSSDNIIRVSLSWLKRTNMSHFDLEVYKGSVRIKHNMYSDVINASNMRSYQNLRTIEFAPSEYNYGQFTIRVVFRELNNPTDSFSVAWY